MGEIFRFNSFEALTQYVEQLTNKPMYSSDPGLSYELWKEQYDAVFKNNVRVVTDGSGGVSGYEFDTSNIVVGDNISVSSSTSGSTSSIGSAAAENTVSQAVGGGGVKSAPAVVDVITDTDTGTAAIGETAKGFKNSGVSTKVPVGNILNGILAAYGLYSLAITSSNWHTWEDVFNTVFPNALPQDATIDDVKAFAGQKFYCYIGSLLDDPSVYVPESIVSRLYDFLSQHMEADGIIEGIEYDVTLNLTGTVSRLNPTSRYWIVNAPLIGPENHTVLYRHMYFSENLLHAWIVDAMSQYLAMGFAVSQSTTDIILSQVNGITEYIRDHKPEALTYKYAEATISLPWSAGRPTSSPVSPGDIQITLFFMDDTQMVINAGLGVEEPIPYAPSTPVKENAFKFSKYGRTGTEVDAYAYKSVGSYLASADSCYKMVIGFLSNEFYFRENPSSYNYNYAGYNISHYTGGYSNTGLVLDTDESIPASWPGTETIIFKYSNLGYTGETVNYKPDDTLTAIVGKKAGEKLPAAASTGLAWDDRYKQWAAYMKTRGTTNKNGQNVITKDVPVSVPYGSETTKKIIDHGYNNPNDPNSYTDNSDQTTKQTGRIPGNTPIDDINESISDSVDDFNDSRTTPSSAPDPVPGSQPLPNYPTNPPTDTEGDTGSTPTPGSMAGVPVSGMVSVYNPTKEEVKNFSAWLWTDNVIDNLKKILANPIDAIIGLHIMYATPVTGSPENIICGYLDSGVQADVVTQQYITVDCGYVDVPEYYGDVLDYEPYTQIHIYLPFVGICSLKANDVVGKRVKVKYGVDVLTGTCLAMINTVKGSSDIQCYTFAGNCAVQIPLTGGNYAEIIKGIASMAVGVAGSVLTANPLPAIGGVVAGAMGSSLDVSHSGSIGANAGVMGLRKPYIIITRKAAYDADRYSEFYGLPSNLTVTLGNCRGYTRVKSVHIDSINCATDTEKTEIETLLKQGIIIK